MAVIPLVGCVDGDSIRFSDNSVKRNYWIFTLDADFVLCDIPMMNDRDVGKWLRAALKSAGVTQTALAAEVYGKPGPLSTLSQSAISDACNGKRGLSVPEMIALSTRLDVPPLSHPNQVLVVGYVGAGAEVHAIDDHMKGGGLETVEVDFPVKPGTVAVIVRGDSMMPIFEDGDMIGYAGQNEDPAMIIGQTCVVKVLDGPTYIKKLKRGSERGLFTLVSANASDIEDVEIEWASPYRFHIPSAAWRSMVT